MLGGIVDLFKSPEKKAMEMLARFVPPHEKLSREVTDKDMKRVLKEAQVLFNLCFLPRGHYKTGYAMAHPQIDDQDPLKFFVTRDQQVIINPVIARYSVQKIKEEGCFTFHLVAPTKVVRYNNIEVEYQTITPEGKLSEKMRCRLSGIQAQFYQHEIDHLNGKYIYGKDLSIYDKSLRAVPTIG